MVESLVSVEREKIKTLQSRLLPGYKYLSAKALFGHRCDTSCGNWRKESSETDSIHTASFSSHLVKCKCKDKVLSFMSMVWSGMWRPADRSASSIDREHLYLRQRHALSTSKILPALASRDLIEACKT